MDVPQETVREIVAIACRAPSVHNTQPWFWTCTDGRLNLYADLRRHLLYADSSRRDLVMSCGAALHHLEVAARAAGWRPHVERLPEPKEEWLLARVTFTPHTPSPDELRLGGAIVRRQTDRRQVSSWPVPAGRIEELASLASECGVLAASLQQHDRVSDLLSVATRLQNRNDAYLDELFAWTHARAQEGVPTTSLLTRSAAEKKPGAFSRFPVGSLVDDYDEDADPAAEWLALCTSSDDPLSWLRTGEALSSIWLTATVAGLSLVPYTQPIEVESTRQQLQSALLNDQCCPQVILRIGWPPLSNEPVAPTPRRHVDHVLDFFS